MIIEDLMYSDYEIEETKQSEIDSEKILHITVAFKCPNCANRLTPLKHDESFRCYCGMYMTRHGNNLHCIL